MSPEFTIDLGSLKKGEEPKTQKGKGAEWLMKAIKPEIEVTVLGRRQIIAPWGRPTKDYTAIASLAVGVVLGLATYGTYILVQGKR